jgi:hypothetical protein
MTTEWRGRLTEEELRLLDFCRMSGGLDTPSFALVRKMGKLLDKYEAMLEHELAGKKRATVIAGLQAHTGERAKYRPGGAVLCLPVLLQHNLKTFRPGVVGYRGLAT